MLKIPGLKTKPTPKPEGWGKARGHEQGPEGRSRGVSSLSSWPQQPWDPRALAEKKVRTLKTPSAAPTGMRTHIHRAPRLAEICDVAPNTRGSYSHGDSDAREVDVAVPGGCPGERSGLRQKDVGGHGRQRSGSRPTSHGREDQGGA